MRVTLRILALLCALGIIAPRTAGAISNEEKEITFWRVAVLPLAGEAGRFSGLKAAARLSVAIEDSRRFEVAPIEKTARLLEDMGIDITEGVSQLEASKASDLSAQLDVDGFIAGSVSQDEKTKKVTFDLSLLTVRGHTFGSGQLVVSPDLETTEITSAINEEKQWLLPYDGLIVRTDESLALMNLGRAHGIEEDQTVYAFSYDNVSIDQDGKVTGRKLGIAEMEVVRLSKVSAWIKPVRGRMPEALAKISREEIELEVPKPNDPQAPVVRRPFLTFGTGLDFLSRDYLLLADDVRVSSETTAFFTPSVEAKWVATRLAFLDVVVRGTYRHGFIPLNREIDGVRESFSAALDQGSIEATIGAANGGQGRLRDARVFASLGYRYNAFTIEEQDPLYLTNDTYHQLIVGGGFDFPLFQYLGARRRRLFLFGEGFYVPVSTITQTPVDNGSGTAWGAFGTAGLRLELTRKFHTSVAWNMDYTRTTFDPEGGSRGFTNPATEDVLQGLVFRLGYVFLR